MLKLPALLATLALVGCQTWGGAASGTSGTLERVAFDGIELHYVASGTGPTVVLIHGSLADYSYWQTANQVAPLAEHHRVIAYSRRYNFPNRNQPTGDHSAIVEAEDLARFIDRIGGGPVHLVGHSYGAYTALIFALKYPDLLRSLVLAEAPVLTWLPEISGGAGIEEKFMARIWRPLAGQFRDHGEQAGLEFTARWYFQVPFGQMEPQWRALFRNNVKEWRALAVSANAFPKIDIGEVRRMRVPTLLLSGGKNAGGFNDLIDGHLHRAIPGAERLIIAGASHEMFLDFPETTVRALLDFLGRH
jgi:non-heme chloroperoxidase